MKQAYLSKIVCCLIMCARGFCPSVGRLIPCIYIGVNTRCSCSLQLFRMTIIESWRTATNKSFWRGRKNELDTSFCARAITSFGNKDCQSGIFMMELIAHISFGSLRLIPIPTNWCHDTARIGEKKSFWTPNLHRRAPSNNTSMVKQQHVFEIWQNVWFGFGVTPKETMV